MVIDGITLMLKPRMVIVNQMDLASIPKAPNGPQKFTVEWDRVERSSVNGKRHGKLFNIQNVSFFSLISLNTL